VARPKSRLKNRSPLRVCILSSGFWPIVELRPGAPSISSRLCDLPRPPEGSDDLSGAGVFRITEKRGAFAHASPFGEGSMLHSKASKFAILAAVCLLTRSASATEGFYDGQTFSSILGPLPVPSGRETTPWDINSQGQIVGSIGNQAFVYNSGNYTILNFSGSTSAGATGINNLGQIVGGFLSNANVWSGYIYDNGNYTLLSDPSHNIIGPYGINDLGEIVGVWGNSGGVETGFIYDDGVYTELTDPGFSQIFPYGINDSGQIVGELFSDTNPDFIEAFLYTNGVYNILQSPSSSAIQTYARGINNSGQIVGYYDDSTGLRQGFMYSDGVYTTIDFPLANYTMPLAINDLGDVVGSVDTAAVPEPTTWATMLIGFAGLGYGAYRRARAPRAA
jgi:probable HAF family extracellular repeat protein